MVDTDRDTERGDFTNKIKRMSVNELNAALRNVMEEKRLNVNLAIIKSEQKRVYNDRQMTLNNVQQFIKNVAKNTGSISDADKPPTALLKSKLGAGTGSFMNLLLSNSSSNTSSSSIKAAKNKEHHYRGVSHMNFNDIVEISDTSDDGDDSDVDDILAHDNDDEDEVSILQTTRVNLALNNRVKSTQLVKKKHSNHSVNAKARPLTTHALTNRSKFVDIVRQMQQKQQQQQQQLTNANQSMNRSRPQYECKTAPLERRRSGFKTEVYDDDISIKPNVAAWLKYKNDKKKREKMGKHDAVFADEKLEKMYYELCAQRDQVPHHTQEQIDRMKQRDPIFAKRYRQFTSAKSIGRPANYDSNDLNARLHIPKWTLQREKEILISETKSEKEILREINLQRQKMYDNRVKEFVKTLPS